MKPYRLVLLLLGLCGTAHADRDIVYAARYYAPPGSHRTSHFHIYRINPDGTGKTQLTFGNGYEGNPEWTVDGRHILYDEYPASSEQRILREMNENGNKNRRIKRLADNSAIGSLPAPGYRLENIIPDTGDAPEQHILVNLKTGRRQNLAVPRHDDDNDMLLPMPGHSLVYAANNHNSTVGTDYFFYRLNPDTGSLRSLTEGQFLAWSPNGLQFCVAPGRDTTPYEKRREPYPVQDFGQTDAQYRTVWFAPLYVRAAAGGPMEQITPRFSYVTGADWRKVK